MREFGSSQKNCVSPWKYLPYSNTQNNFFVSSLEMKSTNLTLNVSVSPRELDFNALKVLFLDSENKQIGNFKFYFFKFCFFYFIFFFKGNSLDFDTEYATLNLAPNTADLDNPYIPFWKVVVTPYQFFWNGSFSNNNTPQNMTISFTFLDVNLPKNFQSYRVLLFDVLGNSQSFDFNGGGGKNSDSSKNKIFVSFFLIFILIFVF